MSHSSKVPIMVRMIDVMYRPYSVLYTVRRQDSTTAEEVARFQRLFPNPSWLTSGRTSGHQNLVSIFPGIDDCLKAKR